METSFLVIYTFLFFNILGTSSNTMTMTSSNVTCIERERQSLLAFKQSLTGRYNLLSTWSGVECCTWKGIGCHSRNGHVVILDLHEKWLEGELSPSLQNLTCLRYLDLSMNNFSGNIPEFLGLFERLEYLNLSGSGFGGVVPHHLGNLSKLQYLDLKDYFLDNTYHYRQESISYSKVLDEPIMNDLGWVSSLSSLRHLDLSGIRIGKHIDWFHPVNMLPSLLTLNLAECYIDIPAIKFINLTSINSLDLSLNYINTTIPIWLSNLTSLMHLNLYGNQFHGKIPDFLGMLRSLASIDLSSNSFESSMPDLLCNLTNLVHLDLSLNMFSGDIPMSLGQLSKLKNLDLSNNSLFGVLSETHFTELRNLSYLSLSLNSIAFNFSSQWLPPFQLQIFEAHSCNIGPHFPKWLQTQTNLRSLDLFNSSIRDTIPEWFEDTLSHILYLDLSNNQIGGILPRFHGNISYRFLKMNSNKFEGSLDPFPSNVNFLDLSDNLLSGQVPQTNETMNPNLEVVNLSNNRFTGSIPVHLCKVPSIQIMDLSDNLLSGDIPQTDGIMNPGLEVVNLSKNRLTGRIPVSLCMDLISIQVLDLSHNTFFGSLPACLGNMSTLRVIDLSNNNITGVVPSSLGALKGLTSLHLHNNLFTGNFPEPILNMTKLVTLDLGNNFFTGNISFWIGEKLSNLKFLNLQSNKFTGTVPLQLCQLNILQYLNLAHNNISGTIPSCFGHLSGMMAMTFIDDYTYYSRYGTSYYEENILASMKGMQLMYTKTIKFLTSLDLSHNNIVGEIPNTLMNLVGLKNLNLSGNLLEGQIPIVIGDLKQLESLDLSMNKLSGSIPKSLSSLYSLSYLKLSFNNLSGPIPVGNQLQTLNDISIYEGNIGLCGPPISRSCNRNDITSNHVGEVKYQDDNAGILWFCEGMGPGFIVGFAGLLGSLHFIRSWRVTYFATLEYVYSWLTVSVLLNLARLRRKLFD